MQTFLPYPDFRKSAQVLDKKRCWKQVIEAKQIINCLSIEYRTIGWLNHPTVKMWKDESLEEYKDLLKHYYNIFLEQCLEVHKINTKMLYLDCHYSYGTKYLTDINKLIDKKIPEYCWHKPFWLGNENFHRAMRARLIEKNEKFYLPKFPDDKGFNDGKYWWPEMGTKTFKLK